MRLNKLCSYASILLSLFFLFCGDERSDIITGAGNDVIKDMDPTLTNIESGFKFIPLVLGEEKEGSVFSIPAKASTNFSTQAASWFMTGVNTKGDTLRANMQFLVSNDTSKYNSRDTRMEAYLHFRAVGDDTTSSGTINVFKSEPLKEITPISGGTVDEADKIGGFELGAIDSIKLADTLAEKIFNARTSDEADTLRFAFSILDYENSVRKINNPYIILRVKKAENESFVRDSIHSAFTFFTAFENGDSIAVRAENPYSSQNTLRTAVFRIDISELIDSANTAAKPSGKYSEVINATLSFKHDETKSDSARYYKYVVLNEPAGSDSLVQNRFTDAAANTLNKNGNNVHSIKPFIRNAIDKQNSKYIYVYLRPTSDHSVIVWDEKSLKVEAVLTPSR